jgi:hypothetical protein
VQPLGTAPGAVRTGGSHRLRALCDASGAGAARLTLVVDGKTVVEARDLHALQPFTSGLAVVVASAPDSEVRFDDVEIDGRAG